MNDSKFIEKVAEEIWDAGQLSSIAQGITFVNFPWSTVTGKIRELYLAMASRAIHVVKQQQSDPDVIVEKLWDAITEQYT
jgi:hypothetical protein